MYADGVDVLHVADGDGGVGRVAHDLVLYLLVAADALFHQHLVDGRDGEGVLGELAQLRLVVGEAAAGAAEGEGRAQHDGVAYVLRRLYAALYGLRRLAGQHGLAQALAELLELLAVLGELDALDLRAQDLDAALVQHAEPLELHREVEARLAAYAGDYGVRALVADYARDVLGGQRLHIHLVGDRGVGHYGGGVGVCEHDLIALLAQGEAGLGAGVVEFGGLAYDDGAGAYDEYLAYVGALRHFSSPSPADLRSGRRGGRCPAGRACSPGGTARRRYCRRRFSCPRPCCPAG